MLDYAVSWIGTFSVKKLAVDLAVGEQPLGEPPAHIALRILNKSINQKTQLWEDWHQNDFTCPTFRACTVQIDFCMAQNRIRNSLHILPGRIDMVGTMCRRWVSQKRYYRFAWFSKIRSRWEISPKTSSQSWSGSAGIQIDEYRDTRLMSIELITFANYKIRIDIANESVYKPLKTAFESRTRFIPAQDWGASEKDL